jgi:hypothetical protein
MIAAGEVVDIFLGDHLGVELFIRSSRLPGASLGRPTAKRFLRPADQGVGAAVAFQRAANAEGVQRRVGVAIDDDVPQFAAAAVDALDQHLLNDDPAADAGAHREQHHAAVLAAGAGPVFAVGSGVGVVHVGDWVAAGPAHQIADRRVVPVGQVAGAEQHAGLEVHRARRREPHPGDIPGRGAPIRRPATAPQPPIRSAASAGPRSSWVGIER